MELWIPAPYATDDFLEMLSNHEHDQHGGMELEYLVKFCSLAAQSRTLSRKAVNKRGEAANPVEFVECIFDASSLDSRACKLLQYLRMKEVLVDDEIWDMNFGILASVAFCNGCDCYGHEVATCPHYEGQERDATNPGYAVMGHFGGVYTVEKVGRTKENERVVRVNGLEYCLQQATGADNNCLIDALRQSLLPNGFPLFHGYLERVRSDLSRAFPSGPHRVRDVDENANFLDLQAHTEAAIRSLIAHARTRDHGGIDKKDRRWLFAEMKIVCVNIDNLEDTTCVGNGTNEILIARENNNHFIPLRRAPARSSPLPFPWEGVEGWVAESEAEARRRRAASEAARKERSARV